MTDALAYLERLHARVEARYGHQWVQWRVYRIFQGGFRGGAYLKELPATKMRQCLRHDQAWSTVTYSWAEVCQQYAAGEFELWYALRSDNHE